MENCIYGIKWSRTNMACTKIVYKGYEISLAMDDSCGARPHLSRTALSVFDKNDGENNITKIFMSDEEKEYLTDGEYAEIYNPTLETLCNIKIKIDEIGKE